MQQGGSPSYRRRRSEQGYERAAAVALIKLCRAEATVADVWVCALSHGPPLRAQLLPATNWAVFLHDVGLRSLPSEPDALAPRQSTSQPTWESELSVAAVDAAAAFGAAFNDAAEGTEPTNPTSPDDTVAPPHLDHQAFCTALCKVARHEYPSEDSESGVRRLCEKLLPYKHSRAMGVSLDWPVLSSTSAFGRLLWSFEEPLQKTVTAYSKGENGLDTAAFQRFGADFGLTPKVASAAGMVRAAAGAAAGEPLQGPRQLLHALAHVAAEADAGSLAPEGGLAPSTMIGRLDSLLHEHFLKGFVAAMPLQPRRAQGDPPCPRVRAVFPSELPADGGEVELRGDNLAALGLGAWVRWDWGEEVVTTHAAVVDADPFHASREGALQVHFPRLPDSVRGDEDTVDVSEEDGGVVLVRLSRTSGRVAVFNCVSDAETATCCGYSGGCTVVCVDHGPPHKFDAALHEFLRRLYDVACRAPRARMSTRSPAARRKSTASRVGFSMSEPQWRQVCRKFGLADANLTAFREAAECGGGSAVLDFHAFLDALLRATASTCASESQASPANPVLLAEETVQQLRSVFQTGESTYEDAIQLFERTAGETPVGSPSASPRVNPEWPQSPASNSDKRTTPRQRALQDHLMAKLRRVSTVIDQLRLDDEEGEEEKKEGVQTPPSSPPRASIRPGRPRESFSTVTPMSPRAFVSPRQQARRSTVRGSRASSQGWDTKLEELNDLVSALAEEVGGLSADENQLVTQMAEARDQMALVSLSNKSKEVQLARARAQQAKAVSAMQAAVEKMKSELTKRDDMIGAWMDVSKGTGKAIHDMEQWCGMLITQAAEETAELRVSAKARSPSHGRASLTPQTPSKRFTAQMMSGESSGDQRRGSGGMELGISRIYMNQINGLATAAQERLREMQRLSSIGRSKDGRAGGATGKMAQLAKADTALVDHAAVVKQIQDYGRDMHEKIRTEQNRNVTDMVKTKLDGAIRVREAQLAAEAKEKQDKLQTALTDTTARYEADLVGKERQLQEWKDREQKASDLNASLQAKLQALEAKLAQERAQKQRMQEQQRREAEDRLQQAKKSAGGQAATARLQLEVAELRHALEEQSDGARTAREELAGLKKSFDEHKRAGSDMQAKLLQKDSELSSLRMEAEKALLSRTRRSSSFRSSPRSRRKGSRGSAAADDDAASARRGSVHTHRTSEAGSELSEAAMCDLEVLRISYDMERRENHVMRKLLALRRDRSPDSHKEYDELEQQLDELRRERKRGKQDRAGGSELRHHLQSAEVVSLRSQLAALRADAQMELQAAKEEAEVLRSAAAAGSEELRRLRSIVPPLRSELERMRVRVGDAEALSHHLAGRDADKVLPPPSPVPEVLVKLRQWRIGVSDAQVQAGAGDPPPLETPRGSISQLPRRPQEDSELVAEYVVAGVCGVSAATKDWRKGTRAAVREHISRLPRTGDPSADVSARRLEWAANVLDGRAVRESSPPPSAWSPEAVDDRGRTRVSSHPPIATPEAGSPRGSRSDSNAQLPPLPVSVGAAVPGRPHTARTAQEVRRQVRRVSLGSAGSAGSQQLPCSLNLVLSGSSQAILPLRRGEDGFVQLTTMRELHQAVSVLRSRPNQWAIRRSSDPVSSGGAVQPPPVAPPPPEPPLQPIPSPVKTVSKDAAAQTAEIPQRAASPPPCSPPRRPKLGAMLQGSLAAVAALRSRLDSVRSLVTTETGLVAAGFAELVAAVRTLGQRVWEDDDLRRSAQKAEEILQDAVREQSLGRTESEAARQQPKGGPLHCSFLYMKCRDVVASEFVFLREMADEDGRLRRGLFRARLRVIGVRAKLRRYARGMEDADGRPRGGLASRLALELQRTGADVARWKLLRRGCRARLYALLHSHSIAHLLLFPGLTEEALANELQLHEEQQRLAATQVSVAEGLVSLRDWISPAVVEQVAAAAEEQIATLSGQVHELVRELCSRHVAEAVAEPPLEVVGHNDLRPAKARQLPWLTDGVIRTLRSSVHDDADLPKVLRAIGYGENDGPPAVALADGLTGAECAALVERIKQGRAAAEGKAAHLFAKRSAAGPATIIRKRLVVGDQLSDGTAATPLQPLPPPDPATAPAPEPPRPATAAVPAATKLAPARPPPVDDVWKLLVPSAPARGSRASRGAPRPLPPAPPAPPALPVPLPHEPLPEKPVSRGGAQWSNLGSVTGGLKSDKRSDADGAYKMLRPSQGVPAPVTASIGCIGRLIRSKLQRDERRKLQGQEMHRIAP